MATRSVLAASLLMAMPLSASAVSFSNLLTPPVEFPAGALSFADVLVSYSPGYILSPNTNQIQPLPPYVEPLNTLGTPDYDLTSAINCSIAANTTDCKFASLGVLGSLVLRFTDNLLTGSGNSQDDLYVFLAGPGDDTFVDISSDGINWAAVGIINSDSGVDIDAFGHGIGSTFSYVRFTDAPGGQPDGSTVGLDIDAVGAISTVAQVATVPLPGALWLFASSLISLTIGGRRSAFRRTTVVSRSTAPKQQS
jgi:hypothetical protein